MGAAGITTVFATGLNGEAIASRDRSANLTTCCSGVLRRSRPEGELDLLLLPNVPRPRTEQLAFDTGYDPILVQDLLGTDSKYGQPWVEELYSAVGFVVGSKDLIACLE